MADVLCKPETRRLAPEQIARITYMRDHWTLAYDRFTEWFEILMDAVATDEPGKLVVLIAPTHVGKTALMKHADRALVEMARQDGLPVMGGTYIRLPAPNRGSLDKGEFVDRLLEATGQPRELLAHTVSYGDIRDGALKPWSLPRAGRAPTHAARMRLLIDRINKGYYSAVFLDEAGEIPLLLKSGRMMEAAMQIKEIADLTRKVAFLAGGPEIAPLLWQNAQLTARIQPVWMLPLDPTEEDDVKQFAGVVNAMAEKLGPDYIKEGVFTKSHCAYMVERLWGTVGLGTKVILRATAASLRRGGEPLDWDDLRLWVDYLHQHMAGQMEIEHKMFYAAMDPESRENYWASASHLAVTPTNFHKKGKDAILVPSVLPKAASNAPVSRAGKRGLTRKNLPERPPMNNLPGEPGADAAPSTPSQAAN
ncbi:hypothetical protein BTHE68_41200 [Burkholderia sp. THE68]|uniref:hypothetical protein n=1 Tax=Burkholderia sp. THE68 TaxID=758782 RepID=UPI0013161FBA|nr:hypothetical protein [Burkholderia sp. THE68]BBU30386.1 hypothetical protein BTHE68_41200 [Burkholderia sp. THE68]